MVLPFDHVDGSARTREQARHCEESIATRTSHLVHNGKQGMRWEGVCMVTHFGQPLLNGTSNLAVDLFLHSNHAPTTSEPAIYMIKIIRVRELISRDVWCRSRFTYRIDGWALVHGESVWKLM